jgi:AcrR family transcriptional regulator
MASNTRANATAPQTRGDAFVQAVLYASLEQLALVGFDRLSIPGVAAAVGANKTSVYRRWPTKEELIKDALRAAMSHSEEATGLGSLRADLMALAQTLAEFLHSNAGRAIIRMLLNDGDNNELRAIAIAAYGDVSRQAAWITLEAAVHRGELKSAVEPTTLLFTLAGALIHRVLVERAVASPTFVEGVVDMLLHGAATQNS